MTPASLLIEAAEKLFAMTCSRRSDGLAFCRLCELPGGVVGHTPDCLITRLRTAAQESEGGEQKVAPEWSDIVYFLGDYNRKGMAYFEKRSGAEGFIRQDDIKADLDPRLSRVVDWLNDIISNNGTVAQPVEARGLNPGKCGFESTPVPPSSPPTLDAEIEALKAEYNWRVDRGDMARAAIDRTFAIMDRRVRKLEKQRDGYYSEAAKAFDKLASIIMAYDHYRGRGVSPAPNEYQNVVDAINDARSIMAPQYQARIALGKPDGGRG